MSNNNYKGATVTEYVLLIGLITAGVILALTTMGPSIATFFNEIVSTISNAASGEGAGS